MPRKIKLMIIMGTRPELIKLAPIIKLLETDSRFIMRVCMTGQHRELAQEIIHLFNIKLDYDLNIMELNQTLLGVATALSQKIEPILDAEKPDWLLVQGDTSSCFIAALAGFYKKIKIAHIEAGLRSHDFLSPYPEEMHRQFTSRLANLHFAPDTISKNNLLNEGVCPEKIIVTGNTIIDALYYIKKIIPNTDHPHSLQDIISKKKFILVTLHRRENHGQRLKSICNGLKQAATYHSNWDFIFPCHPNPAVRHIVEDIFDGIENIIITGPVGYRQFLNLMENCYFIVTDSGGIQEEAPVFGKPVLIVRNITERLLGLKHAVARLIGVNQESVFNNISELISNNSLYYNMSQVKNLYGDGKARTRILNAIYAEEASLASA